MRRHFSFLADLGLVVSATLLAAIITADLEVDDVLLRALVPHLIQTLAVAVPVLMLLGLDRAIWRLSSTTDYGRAALAGSATALLSALAGSAMGGGLLRPALAEVVLEGLLVAMALVGGRVALRWRHTATLPPASRRRAFLARGHGGHRTALIVGLAGVGRQYLRSIGDLAGGQMAIAGFLGQGEANVGRVVNRYEVLGRPEAASEVVARLAAGGVTVTDIILTVPIDRLPGAAQAALAALEAQGMRIDRLVDRMLPRHRLSDRAPVSDSFFQHTELLEARAARPYWRIKNGLDRCVALILMLAALPLLLPVVVLVALDVGMPLMFWQQRPGLGGSPMTVHKFRTMGAALRNGLRVPDAERLSRIGRFLRATRLDELPQLWCILTGAMSFIGPRPLLPIDQPAIFSARLLVRPGLTGYAQVKGGRSISPADKAVLDIWYVKNATLLVDVKILLETVRMVVLGEREDREAIAAAWRDLHASGIVRDLPGDGATGDAPSEAARIAA